MDSDSEMSFTESSSSSDGEVWDEIESEAEDSDNTHGTDSSVSEATIGISFFLTSYHLVFRLSQRAVTNLLGFIRILVYYLAVRTGNN